MSLGQRFLLDPSAAIEHGLSAAGIDIPRVKHPTVLDIFQPYKVAIKEIYMSFKLFTEVEIEAG